MVLDTARVVGLEVCAVDLLELRGGGSMVYEVHSSPGLRELEEATNEDLAVPIVTRALASRASGRPSPPSIRKPRSAR